MKKLLLLTIGLSFLLADQIYELNVENMSCGGCAKNIQKLSNTVATVVDMSFDIDTKDLNLTIKDEDDIQKVLELIKEKGYKAKLKN
ncbi:heavy-metal-associated domain-containing protein [Campylobacter corcagiensis]|uniref:Heavy-metal-associated domain-containing protein n=1 Tax=Campylobacter corcagiensis TaxID=1448857 RepID=A0A7M1LFD5_9BACT|nr:heavy metal-associated domain-containing protein [Campylobacter corcagiensis]QKF64526.1 heavy-metal-associated domain-containing protein [Campylobacter corcagiensis]QOQ87297.1 heavy-metal-associated domain-containing protein [Campylobacter corcagiensis]